MRGSREEADHPHGLKGSQLNLGVQKTDTSEPRGALAHFVTGFQGSAASPNSLPRHRTNVRQHGGRRRRQTALVPEFAENHAVDQESTAFEGTRPGAELVGDCLHIVEQGLPVLRHPLGGAKQVIAEDGDRQRVVVNNKASGLNLLGCVGFARQVQYLGFVEIDQAV